MKLILPTLITLVGCASSVYADDILNETDAAMPPATAQLDDKVWGGSYGGISYDAVSDATFDAAHMTLKDYGSDEGFGIFFGHSFYFSNNLLVGGEIAYSSSEVCNVNYPAYCFGGFLDISARAGYAIDKWHVFGMVGVSNATYSEPLGEEDITGNHFGLGVEYLVRDNLRVGLTAKQRNIDDTISLNTYNGREYWADSQEISFRISWGLK